jgi:hypothetical protein
VSCPVDQARVRDAAPGESAFDDHEVARLDVECHRSSDTHDPEGVGELERVALDPRDAPAHADPSCARPCEVTG